ncbi:MAG: DNA topoisomerase, partial [Terrimicrobiaceae bacterium]|nr:DNA topoisomerase [Terrimicrobiaceae bacterium]
VFDSAKVSDHFAIIPTGVHPKSLDEFESKVFDMIARRFVAAFYPPARFETTVRITRVGSDPFRSEGKVLTDPGWLAVYGKQAASDEEPALCPVRAEGPQPESAQTLSLEIKESQTRPPARFTEATLLSAMESAGKLVEDEDLREAMSQRGLGTPATRAQIIEGLLHDGYIIRQGRELIATQKGLSLIALLRGIGVEALTSPELTGEWEFQLKRMERGEIPRDEFMARIRRFTEEIVAKAKNYHGGEIEGQFTDLEATCPKCGERVFKETLKSYDCRGCGLHIWKNMSGRELERAEVRELLEKRRVGPLDGFRSRFGKPFAAEIILGEDFKQAFHFPEKAAETAPADFSKLPVILEICPACRQGKIHDTGSAYACSNTTACKFRMGKVICQREIPPAELRQLAETGTTSLIPNFISKKGKPFKARLALEGHKVVFQFEERPQKPATARSTAASRRTPAKSR